MRNSSSPSVLQAKLALIVGSLIKFPIKPKVAYLSKILSRFDYYESDLPSFSIRIYFSMPKKSLNFSAFNIVLNFIEP